MSDYYIRFDENGQPYIEHGLKDTFSSVRREGAKYLEKIKTKAGGTRYFYTPEELKAYYNQGKTKVTDAAKNVRAKASNAYNQGRAAVTNASSKVKSTAKTAAEKGRSAVSAATRNARDFGTRTASALKTHGSETLKDITGKSKHERYEEARDRTSKAKDNLANNPNSAHAQREVDEAEAAEAKAHEEYLKSPLGRVNDAKSRAKEIADSAKEKAGSVKDKAKEKAGQAGNKAKELVDYAKDKAKGAVDKAKDKLGFDERDRAEKAWDKYDETDRDEDWDEANRLQDEFNKTPIGKLNSFWERTKENVPTADYIIDKAKEKAGTVKDKAKEKAGQVGDKAKELAGSAKEKAEEVAGKAKDAVKKAGDTIKDKAGIDERERLGDAIKVYNESSAEDKDKAYQEVAYAAQQYMNTPLGKVENGAQKAKTTAKAVAAAAGVAVAAVPAVAIGLPLTAAVVVTRAAVTKVNEIRDNNIAKILTAKSKVDNAVDSVKETGKKIKSKFKRK